MMFSGIVFFFFSSRRRHTRCLSDWSSDVCSSDLARFEVRHGPVDVLLRNRDPGVTGGPQTLERGDRHRALVEPVAVARADVEIGRASCRERVEIRVVAGAVTEGEARPAETARMLK